MMATPRSVPGDLPDTEPSLYGFLQNFCAPQRTQISTYRDAMTQPYVYWTLEAPFVTIIGLYGNIDGYSGWTGNRDTAAMAHLTVEECQSFHLYHRGCSSASLFVG